jgi:two-component system chemotaxis sensor kinase CheA
MDEELYQAFVTESEESITQLNNSLLELESNPEDEEAIDDIFRRAHTLKGNFGAMGFDDAATVAHAIEDLLDEVRQGDLEVTPERMDLVFDGVDRILDILHEIEETGESTTDPSDTVAAIRAAVESGGDADGGGGGPDADGGGGGPDADGGGGGPAADGGSGEGNASGDSDSSPGEDADGGRDDKVGGATEGDADAEQTTAASATAGDDAGVPAGDGEATDGEPDPADADTGSALGRDVDTGDAPDGEIVERARELVDGETLDSLTELFHVAIELDEGGMKGVDAGLFLGGIPESVTVVGADPPRETIEAGEYDDGFELFVAGLGAEETAETFADLWAVERATVTDASAVTGGVGVDGGSVETDAGAANGTADATHGRVPGTENGRTAGTETGTSDGAAVDSHDEDGAEDDDGSGGSDGSGDGDSGSGDAGGGDAGGGDAGGDGRTISEVKSVRVDVDQLDELHELVEQLVTSRIKLRRALGSADSDSLDTLDELDKISSNLQNTVMDMRLIPLKKVFDKFPRLVRDLAREEGKQVNFEVEGQDIELDRTILDEISDPLMHVLRNAVDHGIEPPEEREAAGKDPVGTVELRAEREHDTVVITVEDDGGGLDVERIKDKAVAEGVATREELAALPEEEIFDYIFHPGFSTNEEITDVSGRGVGMDVVKTTVEALDGTVSVSSTPGEGSTFRIRLPVSVAIIKVLFVQVGDAEFGVPIKYIDEIGRIGETESVNGAEVVVHDDRIFPLIRLRQALDVDAPREDGAMVVRIRPADRQVALRCDRVTRQEEVVVTPLEGPLSGAQGLSGTAVIGDGNVIPILDVGTLELPTAGQRVLREGPDVAPEEAAD